MIGRGTWETGVLERADRTRHHGRELPAARIDDLILLKLYAGGSQDRWDIEQSLNQLPADAQRLWRTLVP